MPKSIFELEYLSREAMQTALDSAAFGDPPVLHIPSNSDIRKVREEIEKKVHSRELRDGDVLLYYQRLALSAASSDIICGQLVSGGGHRCGGLMDVEVSVFGAYYQCRVVTGHRFPV